LKLESNQYFHREQRDPGFSTRKLNPSQRTYSRSHLRNLIPTMLDRHFLTYHLVTLSPCYHFPKQHSSIVIVLIGPSVILLKQIPSSTATARRVLMKRT
jgi:hypothetical protein